MKKDYNKTPRTFSRKRPLPPIHYEERIHIRTLGVFYPCELALLQMAGHSLVAYPSLGVWVRSHDFVDYYLIRLDEKNARLYSVRGINMPSPFQRQVNGKDVREWLINVENVLPKRKFVDKPQTVGIDEGLDLLNWPKESRHVGIIPPAANESEHVKLSAKLDAESFLRKYQRGARLFTYKSYIILRFVSNQLFIYFGNELIAINGKYVVIKSKPFMDIFCRLKGSQLTGKVLRALTHLNNDDYIEPPTWISRYEAEARMNVKEVLSK